MCLTRGDLELLKKGAVVMETHMCCDCPLEELWIFEIIKDGSLIARVFRDNAATRRNRNKAKRKKK